MICPHCTKEIEDGLEQCTNCGAKLSPSPHSAGSQMQNSGSSDSQLDLKKKLEILEDRLLLGQISEETYKDLKSKLELRLKQQSASMTVGDIGMVKGDVRLETKIDSHDISLQPRVEGGIHNIIQVPLAPGISTKSEPEGGDCPICGRYREKKEIFVCKKCNRRWICLEHQDKNTYLCLECCPNPKPIVEEPPKIETDKDKPEKLPFEPEMIFVPEGEFIMGSNDRPLPDEKPEHSVYLDCYYIGKYPVTNEEYNEFLKDSCYQKTIFWNDSDFNGPRQPVFGVSWDDAVAYCQWLSQKTGRKYRLPTEAEWEKAARGEDKRKYPWGNQEPDRSYANYKSMVGKTTNVGGYHKGASPYGALDMAGNVWEWCADWYGEDYYEKSPYKNPQGPSNGETRVLRGGALGTYPVFLPASNRYRGFPRNRSYSHGFRCGRTP